MALCEDGGQTSTASEPTQGENVTLRLASRPLGMAGLLVATSAWASLFFIGKPVLRELDPLWFTLLRYTVASLGFAALLFARGPFPWARLRAHGPRLALLGFVGYGVFGAMVLLGLKLSLPSHGAVIMATMPISTQFVRWALDGQRPGGVSLLCAALALLGVALVSGVFAGGGALDARVLAGDALSLAGTLCWVFYTRGAGRFAGFDVLEYSGLTALASWPLLLAAAVVGAALGWTPAPAAEALVAHWHALLYVGIAPSVVAILAYNHGVRTLGVVTGTAFINFVPVSALLMSVALGHPPRPHELAGVALVVGALLLHTLSSQRAALPGGPYPAASRGAA
jgi:drug/metabolite transporter (DMT)-like permease